MPAGDRLKCFKAYDIRGVVPGELNEELVHRIGLACAAVLEPAGPMAVGWDVRTSSADLAGALVSGLNDGGADTRSIGLCGTEMVYHAAAREGMGGGIMITASHNPSEYNGMKMVRRDPIRGVVRPVTDAEGLLEIEERVRTGRLGASGRRGENRAEDVLAGYLARVLSFVEGARLRPLKVVVNPGNGCAGPTVDALAPSLPFELVRVHHEPDGLFPNGVPNPLLPENRAATAEAVAASGADLGVAWDGDFDRCFLFDEAGRFIEGYYVVGLLAEHLLRKSGGGTVIHDPRLFWNTLDQVAAVPGGVAVKCRTGHARIKQAMVDEGALYGGEMSAHHYFRAFASCDTGMVPWLLVAAVMGETGRPLSALVGERMARFPCSGEINRQVTDPERVLSAIETTFRPQGPEVDHFDGLSMSFADRWRLNLRQSDTQPELLRLNVESRGDRPLMEAKTAAILALLDDLDVSSGRGPR